MRKRHRKKAWQKLFVRRLMPRELDYLLAEADNIWYGRGRWRDEGQSR